MYNLAYYTGKTKAIVVGRKIHIVRHFEGNYLATSCCDKLLKETDTNKVVDIEILININRRKAEKLTICQMCLSDFFDTHRESRREEAVTELENSYAYKRILESIFRIQQSRLGIGPIHQKHDKEGSFPFIPNDTSRLVSIFSKVREYLKRKHGSQFEKKTKKFLDAGCGIGNILLLAKGAQLANRYYGLEFFPEVFETAKILLGIDSGPARYYTEDAPSPGTFIVRKRDIATYKHYKRFDIIYYYCPFRDHEKERSFEQYVEDNMKVGAILMPFLKRSDRIQKDERFRRIEVEPYFPVIWEKIKN